MRRRGGEIKRRNPRWGDAITEGKKGRLSFLATHAKAVKIPRLARRKNQGSLESVSRALATSCGTCSRARSQVNTEALAMSHRLTALTIPLSRHNRGRARQGISR